MALTDNVLLTQAIANAEMEAWYIRTEQQNPKMRSYYIKQHESTKHEQSLCTAEGRPHGAPELQACPHGTAYKHVVDKLHHMKHTV